MEPTFDAIFVGCLFACASAISLVVLVMVLMSRKTESTDPEKGDPIPVSQTTPDSPAGVIA